MMSRIGVLTATAAALAALIAAAGGCSDDHAPTVANGTHLYDHTAPDDTNISVTAGDVTFLGNICNCMTTRKGVLITYTLPDGTVDATPSFDADHRSGSVQITQSWNIGPSFVAAQVDDRVAKLRMTLRDGRVDELKPVDGQAVFASTVGFAKLEAFDNFGNPITSCSPAPGSPGC